VSDVSGTKIFRFKPNDNLFFIGHSLLLLIACLNFSSKQAVKIKVASYNFLLYSSPQKGFCLFFIEVNVQKKFEERLSLLCHVDAVTVRI